MVSARLEAGWYDAAIANALTSCGVAACGWSPSGSQAWVTWLQLQQYRALNSRYTAALHATKPLQKWTGGRQRGWYDNIGVMTRKPKRLLSRTPRHRGSMREVRIGLYRPGLPQRLYRVGPILAQFLAPTEVSVAATTTEINKTQGGGSGRDVKGRISPGWLGRWGVASSERRQLEQRRSPGSPFA